MCEDFVFQIKLDVSGHVDDVLAHPKREQAGNDSRRDNQQNIDEQFVLEDLRVDNAPVYFGFDNIQGFSDHNRHDQRKNASYNSDYQTNDELPFVF